MRLVAETMFQIKGGICVLGKGVRVRRLKLPVAGLMTVSPWDIVATEYQRLINEAKTKCGVTLPSPFMTMAFMSLLVIPSLKIGDKGLFDVDKFQMTSLFK